MREAFLERARERVHGMKGARRREIETAIQEGREGGKGEGMDASDTGTAERDREINMILGARGRSKLKAIESASERIDDGSYGMCESCEGEIAEGRLEAMPFTRVCVSCQAEREKEEKLTRRADLEHTYRRVSASDSEEDYS